MKLDKNLARIPDESSVNGLTPASTSEARPSNSMLDQVRRLPETKGAWGIALTLSLFYMNKGEEVKWVFQSRDQMIFP